MHCPEPSSIVEFLAGTLEASETLEAHLDVCEECRRVVAAIGRSRLPELTYDPPPPEDAPLPGEHEDEAIDRVGTVLNDTYRLVRLIGTGGMGWVYEAAHLRVPRHFAVKILHRSSLAEDEALERFKREAEIAGKLGHRNIVGVIDFNRAEDGTPYMVLELLEGEDLGQRLVRAGQMSPALACEVFEQIAAGLDKAHARGIVHRDLKPQNIFLCDEDGEDEVKILDFGISKLLTGSPSDTRSGTVLGTPRYMSPEQAHGRHGEVDARTDIFALGCILFECLSGRPAFDAPSVPSVLHAVCYEPHPLLSTVVPDTPPAVERVVDRALAKEQADRYPSVEAFYEDLVVACRPLEARTVEKAPGRSWRRPMGLGLAAAAVAALAVITWRSVQTESPETLLAGLDAGTAPAAPARALELRHRFGIAPKEAMTAMPKPSRGPPAPETQTPERASHEPKRAQPETQEAHTAPPRTHKSPRAPHATQKSRKAPHATQKSRRAPARTHKSPRAPPTTHEPPRAMPETAARAAPAASEATPEPAERTVEVRLQIYPPNARVRLDGAVVTDNPLRLSHGSGKHRVVVNAEGHKEGVYTVGTDADSKLEVRLQPIPAPLETGLPGPMEEDL